MVAVQKVRELAATLHQETIAAMTVAVQKVVAEAKTRVALAIMVAIAHHVAHVVLFNLATITKLEILSK